MDEKLSSEEFAKLLKCRKNPYFKHVTVTIETKGREGAREAGKLLNILKKLRKVDETERITEKGKTTTKLHLRRRPRYSFPEEKDETLTYETSDGALLVITPNEKGGYDAHLEENLKQEESEKGLETLVRGLKAMADVGEIDVEYSGKHGEEEKLTAEFSLKNIRRPTTREEILNREIKFYGNLQETLNQRIAEMEKEKRPFTQGSLDDIQYWTHLTVGDYVDKNTHKHTGISRIPEKLEARKKLLELADFLRELYGLVEIKTRKKHEEESKKYRIVTKEDIQSEKKPRGIARERHIMMYMTRRRFPFLSSTDLGAVFGPIGKPKNHATILLAVKLFKNVENKVGRIRPSQYDNKEYTTKELYDDASKKFDAYLKDKSKKKGK